VHLLGVLSELNLVIVGSREGVSICNGNRDILSESVGPGEIQPRDRVDKFPDPTAVAAAPEPVLSSMTTIGAE
jgi:hypothetical protein